MRFFFNQNLALCQIKVRDFPSLFCDLKELRRRKKFLSSSILPPTLRVKQNLPYLIPKHIDEKGSESMLFLPHIRIWDIAGVSVSR